MRETTQERANRMGYDVVKLQLSKVHVRWALIPRGLSPRRAAETAAIFRTLTKLRAALDFPAHNRYDWEDTGRVYNVAPPVAGREAVRA